MTLKVNANGEVVEASHNHGWVDGEWHKAPLPWGFSAEYGESKYVSYAAAGGNTLTASTVPSGEVWVVETISAADITSPPDTIMIEAFKNSTMIVLLDEDAKGADRYTTWCGRITLAAGDYVRVEISGVTSGDQLYMRVGGYKMKIAE
jgi:hypothetical protein